MNFKAIDHVALGVRNLKRAAQWYENVLGFKKCRPTDPYFQNEYISMMENRTNSAIKIALLQIEGEGSSLTDVRRARLNRTICGHFALRVDSKKEFDEFRKGLINSLNENGATNAEEKWSEHEDYGVQESIFFRDLDLNE